MKIIDILNKIANGEEPPKKIVFKDTVYEYDEADGDYRNVKNYDALFDYHEITDILNDEVEILETTIKPDLGTIICYKKGETNSPGYVGVVEKINEDGSVCLKQDDKIGKLNDALFDDNDLTTINKLKHLAYKINEIIDRWNNEK